MTKRIGLWLLLLAIIGWFAVVRGQIKTFSQNTLSVKVTGTEVKSYDQRIADLKLIKSQGDSVQSTLKALYLAMPKSSQVPEALVMLESIGSNSGVTFTNASVGTEDGTEVPINLSFTGNQASVMSFLDAVNANVRTAIVRNQTLISDRAGNITATIQLGLVYQGGTNAVQ